MSEDFDEKKKEAFVAYLESDGEIPFDMYSVDLEKSEALQEIFPGLLISSAGGIVPFQAEGLIDGYPFYYRDRHGWASLTIGEKDGEPPYLMDGSLYSAGVETEEFGGGDNFLKNLTKLIPALERSPFLYHFEGWALDYDTYENGYTSFRKTDMKETIYGWGQNVDEAWEYVHKFKEHMREYGWDEDFQSRKIEAQEIGRVPVNQDERVFPEPEPVFRVNLSI